MKIRIKSFYQWCEENDLMWIIDLWDYELNGISPKEVNYSTSSKYYFKCPRGIHDSELSTICNITGDKKYRPHCRQCASFGQWCLDEDHHDLLDRWDYDLNSLNPFEVSKFSCKKFYFKCPVNNPLHKSELKPINNVVQQEGSRGCCGCNSFGQWGIDNIDPDFIEKYWSDKNAVDPFIIPKRTAKKVWIKCQEVDYHDDYEIACSNFTAGKRCPYCINHKIHPKDSLGAKNPNALLMWSDLNDKSPFEYAPFSNQKIYIDCHKHGIQKITICVWNNLNCHCPECLKEQELSSYEIKVRDYLDSFNYTILHENKCTISPINPKTGCNFYYDNEVLELSLIIEVHGEQHYHECLLTKLSSIETGRTIQEVLEYQKWKDEFKLQYAINHGYSYLVIPYTAFETNTQDYKTLIDNKLKEIIS